MWVVFNATLQPLYPQERPGTHCIGGWVGQRLVRTGAGNLASTGTRSPDLPVVASQYTACAISTHHVKISSESFLELLKTQKLFCSFLKIVHYI